MNRDSQGNVVYQESELIEKLYTDRNFDISKFFMTDVLISKYKKGVTDYNLEPVWFNRFDSISNNNYYNLYYVPEEYKRFDIEAYVYSILKYNTIREKERVALELHEFEARGLTSLLIYLKYLVDTMRKHNIVWGVGRGSSVASYVLFLIGVHKIDSLKYDLPIDDFFK